MYLPTHITRSLAKHDEEESMDYNISDCLNDLSTTNQISITIARHELN